MIKSEEIHQSNLTLKVRTIEGKITALSCRTTFNVYIICRYSSQGITISLKKEWDSQFDFFLQSFISKLEKKPEKGKYENLRKIKVK